MKLSVQIEFDKTLDLVTSKKNVVVGRSPKSDLVIPHDSISRTHCRVEVEKGIFYLTDLGSSNGTFIDGQKLNPDERTPFLSTSQLTMGRLDCEISEYSHPETPDSGAQPVSTNGDYTATIRVSRLDLNKAVRPPAPAAKSVRPNSPRNPISQSTIKPRREKESKKAYIVMFIIVSIVMAYLISEGLN